MALGAGAFFLGFTGLFPEEVFFNIPGEKGEENADHEGVVDDADAGQGLGDEVERIDEIEEAEEAADEGAGGPLAVPAGEEVAKHGGGGADQGGKVRQLRAGAEGVHGLSLEDGKLSTMELSLRLRFRFR